MARQSKAKYIDSAYPDEVLNSGWLFIEGTIINGLDYDHEKRRIVELFGHKTEEFAQKTYLHQE